MAGRSSRRGGHGTGNERIQALVEQKLVEGLQYEALQLYRGVVSRKSARGDDATALAMAEQGIRVLLREGYADSATELGNVLVGILTDHELAPTEERVDAIKRVNAMYDDAKRAAVLAEEDRKTQQQEEEGGGLQGGQQEQQEKGAGGGGAEKQGNGVNGKNNGNAARGMPSVGTLQV